MQSLQSSSSHQTAERTTRSCRVRLYSPWILGILRLIVGATFVVSGFVKGVDPWGSVIKIGEYLTVWGLDVVNPLVVFAAFALGALEFVWGMMLLLGCYRRVSVWILSLMMAGLLPLTLYIWIASPVDDCGCFGDFITLSNGETFLKNVVLSSALVYLLRYNTRLQGLFTPYVQWIVGGAVTIYILSIEFWGYNIQPLIDFRPFAEGVSLVDDTDDGLAPVFEYRYTKGDVTKAFTIDSLPDDSWTYVDRIQTSGGGIDYTDGFTVLDQEGEDVGSELIDADEEQFIVTIPDINTVDISYTYIINDLNDFIQSRGGRLIALIGHDGDADGLSRWKDISMASYPIYTSDPKMLKEMARGHAALIFVRDGRIVWKRSLSSIGYSTVSETPHDELIQALNPRLSEILKYLTLFWAVFLLILWVLDRSGKLLAWHIRRRKIKALTVKNPAK